MICIQNLVRYYQFVLELLSRNDILTSIKGRYSVQILRKTKGNKPKLDLVNVDMQINFGLSIGSPDIERKRNSDVNQGKLLRQIMRTMTGNNPKLELVNVDVHTKFRQILSFRSQAIERKQNSEVNQGP